MDEFTARCSWMPGWSAVWRRCRPAPLPPAQILRAFQAVSRMLPKCAECLFDTAFHATMPAAATTYALPVQWRRDGPAPVRVHGSRTLCVAPWRRDEQRGPGAQAPPDGHLPPGCRSLPGRGARRPSVDTTMGFTPTRAWSWPLGRLVDPGCCCGCEDHVGMPSSELASTLEHRSGLLGLSGTADMRRRPGSGKQSRRRRHPRHRVPAPPDGQGWGMVALWAVWTSSVHGEWANVGTGCDGGRRRGLGTSAGPGRTVTLRPSRPGADGHRRSRCGRSWSEARETWRSPGGAPVGEGPATAFLLGRNQHKIVSKEAQRSGSAGLAYNVVELRVQRWCECQMTNNPEHEAGSCARASGGHNHVVGEHVVGGEARPLSS